MPHEKHIHSSPVSVAASAPAVTLALSSLVPVSLPDWTWAPAVPSAVQLVIVSAQLMPGDLLVTVISCFPIGGHCLCAALHSPLCQDLLLQLLGMLPSGNRIREIAQRSESAFWRADTRGPLSCGSLAEQCCRKMHNGKRDALLAGSAPSRKQEGRACPVGKCQRHQRSF